MKQENPKNVSKSTDIEWVDIHDEDLMIQLGIHQPDLEPRDPSVWTKTSSERKFLKSLRHFFKAEMRASSMPRKSIPVIAKLVIQLKPNSKFQKSTYSTACWMHDIGSILAKYTQINQTTGFSESLVNKYSYNGKTYLPGETPFWE